MSPDELFTSCQDIDCPLPLPPGKPDDPCLAWYYEYSKWYENQVRCKIRNAIICCTEPHVNEPGQTCPDDKTIMVTVEGFSQEQLDAVVAANDIRIGGAGTTTIKSVRVKTPPVAVGPRCRRPNLR